jgi:hypothetical protein
MAPAILAERLGRSGWINGPPTNESAPAAGTARGANQIGPGKKTFSKSIGKSAKAQGVLKGHTSALYDGRRRIGQIIEAGDRQFGAFDIHHHLIGEYRTRVDAMRAVSRADEAALAR